MCISSCRAPVTVLQCHPNRHGRITCEADRYRCLGLQAPFLIRTKRANRQTAECEAPTVEVKEYIVWFNRMIQRCMKCTRSAWMRSSIVHSLQPTVRRFCQIFGHSTIVERHPRPKTKKGVSCLFRCVSQVAQGALDRPGRLVRRAERRRRGVLNDWPAPRPAPPR